MQQNQDIKGFTILELLVVVVIVVVISAVGYPKFNDWKKEREVRVAAANIVSMMNGIVSQSKRGSFSFVGFFVTADAGKWPDTGEGDKIFLTRGMYQDKFVKERASLKCSEEASYWNKVKVHRYKADVKVSIEGEGSACFSKDSSIYLSGDKLKDKGFIVLCNNSTNIGKTCNENKPKKPAYKITWNRFGNISQYKWSGSGWTIQ